jgi:hypothetical protein
VKHGKEKAAKSMTRRLFVFLPGAWGLWDGQGRWRSGLYGARRKYNQRAPMQPKANTVGNRR